MGWDAADAVAENMDVVKLIAHGSRLHIQLPPDDYAGDTHWQDDDADEENQTVPRSDDALALSFTKRYQHDWRYVAAWGRWLMWDGQRWRTNGPRSRVPNHRRS